MLSLFLLENFSQLGMNVHHLVLQNNIYIYSTKFDTFSTSWLHHCRKEYIYMQNNNLNLNLRRKLLFVTEWLTCCILSCSNCICAYLVHSLYTSLHRRLSLKWDYIYVQNSSLVSKAWANQMSVKKLHHYQVVYACQPDECVVLFQVRRTSQQTLTYWYHWLWLKSIT